MLNSWENGHDFISRSDEWIESNFLSKLKFWTLSIIGWLLVDILILLINNLDNIIN